MKILFNDIIQNSNAPPELTTSALSNTYTIDNEIIITLDKQYPINAIGIGNTDGVNLLITLNGISFNVEYENNGLYMLGKTVIASQINILTDATYIGRLGAGIGIHIPTSVTKEYSLHSTAVPRTTLSGQEISGAGGYNYQRVSLDSRYKIDSYAINEIKNGYKTISQGYPFFIDFSEESYKLPLNRLYAIEKNQKQFSFESGVLKYLYSRRFEFEERF